MEHHAGAFDYTEAIIEISPDAYIPFTPPVPGVTGFPGNVELVISSVLGVGATLIPAKIGATNLTAVGTLVLGGIVLRTGSVTLTVAKTLTAAGIATSATGSTVTLIVNKTLTTNASPTYFAAVGLSVAPTLSVASNPALSGGAVSLTVNKTLTTGVIANQTAAVSMAATSTLTASATLALAVGFGSAPFGSDPFGSGGNAYGIVLSAVSALTVGTTGSISGAVNLNAAKALTVGPTQTRIAAVALTVGKTLTANGTVVPSSVLPVVQDTKAASGASAGGNAVVTKPTGIIVGDLLIGISLCDNDGTLAAMTGPSWTLQASNAAVTGGRPGIKIWTKIATSTETGATNFTFSSGIGVYCSAVVMAIQATTFNATTPLSATPTFNGSDTNATGHVAPSIGTGVNNGLLVTVHGTDQGGAATCSYTPPSGMTERADTSTGSGFTCLEVNTVALSGTGATGTKSATCTASRPCNCASFIINPG